jgi:hypothetical protein
MKAFHFIGKDFRSEDDRMCGISTPWQIGQERTYTPFSYDFGDSDIHRQYGYQSSPILWEAFLNSDGPVACLVEVSEPVHREADEHGARDFSLTRKLIGARNLEIELRRLAITCAERAIRRADAGLVDDREVQDLLQKARQQFASEPSSSEPSEAFRAGLESASQNPGIRGRALCVAASANFPEAVDAARLVVEMAGDLARAAALDEAAERRSHRVFFDATFARAFATIEPKRK